MSDGSSPASAIACEAAVDRQRDRVDHQPAADLRHADAGDGDVVLELLRALRHRPRHARRLVDGGERDPCRSRRWARTAGSTRRRRARSAPAPSCPTCTSPGSQPTMLVVRRTRSSSSMATIAITYGGGKLGSHVCSLTVNPATTARPTPRPAPTRSSGSTGTPAPAGDAARRTRCSAGTGACRPRPTSRRTRWCR